MTSIEKLLQESASPPAVTESGKRQRAGAKDTNSAPAKRAKKNKKTSSRSVEQKTPDSTLDPETKAMDRVAENTTMAILSCLESFLKTFRMDRGGGVLSPSEVTLENVHSTIPKDQTDISSFGNFEVISKLANINLCVATHSKNISNLYQWERAVFHAVSYDLMPEVEDDGWNDFRKMTKQFLLKISVTEDDY